MVSIQSECNLGESLNYGVRNVGMQESAVWLVLSPPAPAHESLVAEMACGGAGASPGRGCAGAFGSQCTLSDRIEMNLVFCLTMETSQKAGQFTLGLAQAVLRWVAEFGFCGQSQCFPKKGEKYLRENAFQKY